MAGSHPTAGIQSVYSTDPADLAIVWFRIICIIFNNEMLCFKFDIVDDEFKSFQVFDMFCVFL